MVLLLIRNLGLYFSLSLGLGPIPLGLDVGLGLGMLIFGQGLVTLSLVLAFVPLVSVLIFVSEIFVNLFEVLA